MRPPAVQTFSSALEEGLRRELVAELCTLTDEPIREVPGGPDAVPAQLKLDREN